VTRRPTGTTPGPEPSRFPGFDVIAQRRHWDEVTSGVVLARLGPTPPLRAFTASEEPTARALLDRLLAQDDEPRVPVLELVDQRLADGVGDGYRHVEMPDDAEAWHRSLRGLDDDARAADGRRFAELDREGQEALVEEVRTTDGDRWGMPAGRLFSLWMRYACTAFYSHPWAWNEIGFGGPAFPRGYGALGVGKLEPWEVREQHAHDPIPWARRKERALRAMTARRPDPEGTRPRPW
jgi:hypothetical protein